MIRAMTGPMPDLRPGTRPGALSSAAIRRAEALLRALGEPDPLVSRVQLVAKTLEAHARGDVFAVPGLPAVIA